MLDEGLDLRSKLAERVAGHDVLKDVTIDCVVLQKRLGRWKQLIDGDRVCNRPREGDSVH